MSLQEERHIHREEGHMKIETEARVMQLQTKKDLGYQKLGEARRIFPWSLQREPRAAGTSDSDSWPPER